MLIAIGTTAFAGEKGDVVWTDAKTLPIEGKAFKDTKSFYDRLPARAEDKVRGPVWNLSRNSAGMAVRFVTDATAIHARWSLTSPKLEMVHMPATGVSGVDLYVKSPEGQWRWLAVGRPSAQTNTQPLIAGLPPGNREYLLYFPLYNGVTSLEIGVAKESKLAAAPPYPPGQDKPLVFYGTSITHGACASRPGMVHTAMLGRWLGRPVVNLGFSGNGRMEAEVGNFLTEIDAGVYILDCLPNMTAADISKNAEPLVHQLRKARPNVPILLVEDRSYANSHLIASTKDRNATSRKAYKEAYENLKKAGVSQLYYLPGDDLIGDDTDGTVDNSHPNDLGFYRQAQVMKKALAPILK